MRKSIRSSILLFVVLPFLLVYIILSATMIYQAYQAQTIKTRRELLNMAQYCKSNLINFYEFAELSVRISATELEMLDYNAQNARSRGENILTSRFNNAHVINAWLIFEPNAFDGRDALHTGDYSGAPSGQYIRSFNRKGNSWEIAPDITETMLDNQDMAYWYIIPRDTGKIFTDLGEFRPLWDYKNNKTVSSISVAAPVFRNGKVIGCAGLDFEMDEEILGATMRLDVQTTIFLSDGRLGYSVNTGNVGKTLETLEFDNVPQIRKAMQNREQLLYNGYSGISHTKSLNYFYPVRLKDRFIYIYIALPLEYVWQNMFPVLKPIGFSIFVSLVMFFLLLQYLSRGISKPIQKLTQTSEAIVAGNLDLCIEYTHSEDELNMITRALGRMVDQFKISKLLQLRYQNRFDVILDIHYALFRSESLSEAFNATLKVVAEYFRISKGTLIIIQENSPRIAAVYPPAALEEHSEFFSHHQVVKLIGNKKHLVMNYGTLSSMQLPFVGFSTKSLCILPLRTNECLMGYIIMEENEPEPFVHDDTILLFIGDTLAYLLESLPQRALETAGSATGGTGTAAGTGTEAAEEPLEEPVFIQPENTEAFLEKAKNIQNLNVDKGLLLIGGEKEQYTELLRITIKVIGEGIQKMRGLYAENSTDFGIEIHGMKGALYNIGAELLGDEARKLEFAAKSDDTTYCQEHYPGFEEKLRILSRNLASLFPQQESGTKTGTPGELKELLQKIQETCANFDNTGAQSLLARANSFKWEDERIVEALRKIGSDVENLEYEGAAEKIKETLQYLGSGQE
ncbi:MAG: HAMP domain-containing protein [Spirochaetaceae bacterium]|jgi:HPt (histidine-containing phosphotransfer) domain-containing protein/HAMP domain-containing protein|nr:HAMP domain-containing protein [Spirochaetaceae bacterium]